MTAGSNGKSTGVIDIKQTMTNLGWKKHSSYVYKKIDHKEFPLYISVLFKKNKSGLETALLSVKAERLNQISFFMWDYGRKFNGLYKAPRLTAGQNINDFRCCFLFGTDEKLVRDVEEAANSFVQRSIEACVRIGERFDTNDRLVDFFEEKDFFKGPLMCMHMYREDYRKVRSLLNADSYDSNHGAGDIRYGINKYLRENSLA